MKELQEALRSLWQPLRAPTDHALVRAYSARSLDLLEAAQHATATQHGAYFEEVLKEMGVNERPTLLPKLEYPRTVDNPIHVYERPAEQYRYGLSKGEPEEVAVERALERVVSLATNDLILTDRKLTNDTMKKAKVKRYRRVIHLEVSETGTCGLCLAASTRIYSVSDLLPIHNNCACTVLPIVGREDPGKQFNEDDLKKLYELSGGTGASRLTKVKYRIDNHGELGPYLVPKQRAAKVENASKASNADKVKAQIASLTKTLPELREKAKKDPSMKSAVTWQENRLDKLKKELRNA